MTHLYTSFAGVEKSWHDNHDGTATVRMVQPVAAMLDRNQAMANHNDGYSPSREMRRAASVPMSLIMKWYHEEGWWFFDPDCKHKVVQKLNDPDYAYLRTAGGRLATDGDVIR